MDADAVEIRVLGCLIEKQRTTPDQYPLSLNALRLACNQATNRDPIVEYDDATIRAAMERLSRRGWARLASGPGTRVAMPRQPGQSQDRWVQLLGRADDPAEAEPLRSTNGESVDQTQAPLEQRVAELERQVAELQRALGER